MFIYNVIVLMMVIASHGSLSKQFKNCECSMWINCKTATTTNPSPTNAPLCESPWKGNNGHCYQFISTRKDFQEASKHCNDLSAELVSIHSEEENDFVRDLVSVDGNAQYMIGFHDTGTEGNFEWEDGSDSDFTNWNADHRSGEDCTQVVVVSGEWNDLPCTSKRRFVCKK